MVGIFTVIDYSSQLYTGPNQDTRDYGKIDLAVAMTKEKRKGRAGLPDLGTGAKLRHDRFMRAQQHEPRIWQQLNPLKEPPKVKHKTYFEAVENKEKKKKLEFQVTDNKTPPPGLEFVPTGYPELTSACKELSREQEALFYIVSENANVDQIMHHVHRLGYHFRERIIDKARETLRKEGIDERKLALPGLAATSPNPQDQREMDRQADAILRDLFPRIPNTDRQEIISHAFQKDSTYKGKQTVGGAEELPLARRVQLAALAHIRHQLTRYDELLRETDWANARKAVEQPCIDIIVKWRGDEETGRDQLDEILREVIEISDSEDDSEESSAEEAAAIATTATQHRAGTTVPVTRSAVQETGQLRQPSSGTGTLGWPSKMSKKEKRQRKLEKRSERMAQRYRRYAAIAEANAVDAQRSLVGGSNPQVAASAISRTTSLHTNHYNGTEREAPSLLAQVPHSGFVQDHDGNTSPDFLHLNRIPGDRSSNLVPVPVRPEQPPRGQSPLFIRQVKDGHAPKVGLPFDRQAPGQASVSPVRHHLEDMLVPSIEPRSPNVPTDLRRSSYYDHHASQPSMDIPRVVSRTIVHHPMGYMGHPGSPVFVRSAYEETSHCRRATRHEEDIRPFSDAGFIRLGPVYRDDGPRLASYENHSGRPLSQAVRASSGMVVGRRSPVVYLGDSPYSTRNEIASRTSSDPIYVDTPPRPVARVTEMRGLPVGADFAMPPPRRVEVTHTLPAREVRRVPDRTQIIYVDDLGPSRAKYHGDYRLDPPHDIFRQASPTKAGRPFAHSHEPHPHRVGPAQPDYDVRPHDGLRDPEFRPLERTDNVIRGPPTTLDDVDYTDARGSRDHSGYSHQPENRPYEEEHPHYANPIHQPYPIHENPQYFNSLRPAPTRQRHYPQHQTVYM